MNKYTNGSSKTGVIKNKTTTHMYPGDLSKSKRSCRSSMISHAFETQYADDFPCHRLSICFPLFFFEKYCSSWIFTFVQIRPPESDSLVNGCSPAFCSLCRSSMIRYLSGKWASKESTLNLRENLHVCSLVFMISNRTTCKSSSRLPWNGG